MALYFPHELATSVEIIGEDIVITQYSSDENDDEVGRVVLTRHQFDEVFNRSKSLFDTDK